MYPDITGTTSYYNLQCTGYEDGGLSPYQQSILERITDLEQVKFDCEVMLDDVEDITELQERIVNLQGWIDCLWDEYYESRGVA